MFDPTTAEQAEDRGAPVSTLRGAGVEVNGRPVARVALAVAVASITALAVVLGIAGLHKNAQITALQQHGVPVVVTVTTCEGLLGGSGSNPAGYACRGTYRVAGQRYSESIPGNVLRRSGSTLTGVTVPSDPSLLSTPRLVSTQRASATVFIVPALLLLVVVGWVGFLVRRRRQRRAPALLAGRAALG